MAQKNYLTDPEVCRIRGSYWARRPEYCFAIEMAEVVGFETGHRVFDVGCGECDLERYLKDEWKFTGTYIGVDREKMGANIVCDLNSIAKGKKFPFADRFFHWAFCLELIEHIEPENQFALISEMKRVSRSIMLITPNAQCDLAQKWPDLGHVGLVDALQLRSWNFKWIGYVNFCNKKVGRLSQDPKEAYQVWGVWQRWPKVMKFGSRYAAFFGVKQNITKVTDRELDKIVKETGQTKS
jgi:hypothetical protein